MSQQITDPTHTLQTWYEASVKTEERLTFTAFNTINTEEQLNLQLLLLQTELLDLFDDYIWLMMMKGILFATEHMNIISPLYHQTTSWTPADDALREQLVEGCRNYLTNWTDDIRDKAAQEIREGIGIGLSAEEIGNRVADAFGTEKYRGVLIARTELMRAWNAAAYDRYLKAGFGAAGTIPPLHPDCRCGIRVVRLEDGQFKIVWMTARDPKVCDLCEPLDGIPIDEIAE